MNIHLLISLLPVVFILHDLEEIIMFKPWLSKNKEELKSRFPKAAKLLLKTHDHLSVSGFAVAVLFILIVLTAITYLSLIFENYSWWFGAFAVFTLHLVVHIVQWIIYAKYVPFIITSLLFLPCCIYTFIQFLHFTSMSSWQMVLWTMIGFLLTAFIFFLSFSVAGKFEQWINRYSNH